MKILRLFNSLPKRLFAGFLLFLAAMLPIATSAASTVTIEGSMGVANVTRGDTSYAHSVDATYNQVVKLQVYYHNTELPDSGKTAQNLKVKINLPSTPGKVQKQTATISADNSNTVTDSTTVNLDRSDAYLQYIPGSAVWRHNTGTNDNKKEVDTTVSDSIVTSGAGLRLENEKPCYNFSATVTVLARVMVPGVSIDKYARVKGTHDWQKDITAKAGDTVQYEIVYKNTGNQEENSVVIGDKLPDGISYVPGTTYLANDSAPNGKSVADGVTTSGIGIGNYAPGVNAFVMFDAKLPTADKLKCGDNLLRNIASAQPKGMDYFWNTADVHVTKTDCQPKPPTPSYSCDLLTLAQGDNRTVKASVTHSQAHGAVYKSTSFNWGDGSVATSGSATSASHAYAKDGTYTVVATVSFDVNGVTKTDTGKCKATVPVKTPTTPVYACNLLQLHQGDNRTVTAGVTYTATKGVTLKTITFNWGDGSTPLTTDKNVAQYQYAKDGTYTVTTKLLFSVNGKDVIAPDNEACSQQVTFTTPPTPPVTPPTELPNTGAGNVIGLVAGVAVISAIGYRLFLGRKLARH